MLGEDARSFLGGLQWGSVCLNGTESNFLWAAVRQFCEDVRICALAWSMFETTVFKGSDDFILF